MRNVDLFKWWGGSGKTAALNERRECDEKLRRELSPWDKAGLAKQKGIQESVGEGDNGDKEGLSEISVKRGRKTPKEGSQEANRK